MPRWLLYPQREFGDPETIGDAEAVKVEEFWQPFSEPLRALPGVLFAAVLATSTGTAPIDPETLNDPETDRLEWFAPFSQPVLERRADYYAATFAAGVAPIDPETLNDPETDRAEWLPPLSEPVPRIAGLHASNQQAFFIDPEALGETAIAADESTEWLPPLSEPVPQRVGLHASEQQAFVTDPETLGDPETDRLQWFVSFSEPVRPELRYQHDASFPDPETIGDAAAADTSVEWFVAFSEPVLPLGPMYAAALAASGMVIDPVALGVPGPVVIPGTVILRDATLTGRQDAHDLTGQQDAHDLTGRQSKPTGTGKV